MTSNIADVVSAVEPRGVRRAAVSEIVYRTHSKLADLFVGDEIMLNLLRRSSFLAGGAIASLMRKEQPKDFDYWFLDEESANKARYLFDISAARWPQVEVLAKTGNAVTFKMKTADNTVFQFITRVCGKGSPRDVVRTFDFQHTTAYAKFNHGIVFPEDFEYLVDNKLLRVHPYYEGPLNPARLAKFEARGWRLEDPGTVQLHTLARIDDKDDYGNPIDLIFGFNGYTAEDS